MKVLFLIAVWVNIVFFLWESNFGNTDNVYESDNNATKQILLQSELLKDKAEEKQTIVAENKAGGLTQDQLPQSSVKNEVKPTITKGSKAEILQKDSVNAKISTTNDKTSGKEGLNNQNDTPKLKALNNKETALYAGQCYQIGPFASTDAFGEWVKFNKIDSSSVVLLKEGAKTFDQYMVYYPATDNLEESNKNMEKIKESGIADAWLFENGEFKGGISLGLYDREKPAKLRVEKLAAMNIDAEIKIIHKTTPALYSKISTKNNKSKLKVFLSDKQVVSDCEI